MKKVLIITYSFPPINLMASRRYGDMAPHMPVFGWEPVVLTTSSQGDLPVKIPEENIIRIGEHCDSKKTLVSDEGYRGIPMLLKFPYFLSKVLGIEFGSFDRFLFSWGREVLRKKEIIEKINPEAIIATSYPCTAIWLGSLFSKKLKKPWLADFRDPSSLWNNSRFPLVKFFDRKIDKFLVKSAAQIITVSPTLALEMEKLYQRPVKIIYHGFDCRLEKNLNRKNHNPGNRKIIYYAGRFHPHRLPALKLFLDWMSRSKENVCFAVRSLGPAEANEEILKYAREKKILPKIDLKSSLSPEKIYQEEKEADILILFEDLEGLRPFSQGTVTGKLFEYLPFQAPILAVARQDSVIKTILSDTQRGFLVSDIAQIKKAVEDILKGSKPSPDRTKVQNYSRQSQCKILCQLLDQMSA